MRVTRPSRAATILAGVSLALASACSGGPSNTAGTVDLTKGRAQPDGAEAAAGTPDAAAEAAAATEAAAAATSGAGRAKSPTGGAAGQVAPSGVPQPPGGRPPGGRGTTSDGILRIGIPTVDSAQVDTFGKAIGVDGAALGDIRKIASVSLDAINRSGGYAGYKVQPVFWEGNLADALTPEGRQREAERACATWQEDNQVFSMLGFGGTSYALLDCAKKYSSPLIDIGRFMLDRDLYTKYREVFYGPDTLMLEHRERMLVEGLARQGALKSGAKVALLLNGEQPYFTRVADKVLAPAIQATGAQVVAKASAPDHFNSPWSTYVLQFRQAGATHVVFGGLASVYMSTLFMRAAEDQGWRPAYGMTSDNGIGALTELAPKEQVKRIYGVGYRPTYDHGPAATGRLNSTDVYCEQIYKAAGVEYNGTAAIYCGNLMFLKHALDRATAINAAALSASVEALGSSYPLLDTWATRLGPGDHFGPNGAKDIRYDEGCGCFPPGGPVHPIPQD